MEAVTAFLSLVSRIIVDGDCSHGNERHLLLGSKAMTNLDSILKSRDITLLTKVSKATCQRTESLELCWRRLFRVPWTARRSNQSILKESTLNIHWKDWCWSWNYNTLVTWCKDPTHWKRLWCWEKLKAGGEVDDRGWDGWMASLTQWTWVWGNSRR